MKYFFIVILILGLLVIYHIYEHSSLQVTFHKLTSNKVAEKLRIVVLSDLHNKKYGQNNEKLIKRLKELKADLFLIPGDIIVDGDDVGNEIGEAFVHSLAKLGAPIYYSLGNHEYRYRMTHPEEYEAMVKGFLDCGVHFLDNNSEKGPMNLQIYGLSIPLEKYRKLCKTPKLSIEEIRQMLPSPEAAEYSVLLAHNPVYFDQFCEWGADLTLAGHMHGGLVRVPGIGALISPQFKLFPKYDAGLYEKNGHSMYVSRGLGTHTINIRVYNRPEIAVIDIN